VSDHLELLLREICDRHGPFGSARQEVHADRWELHLEIADRHATPANGEQGASDMSRALLSAACTVYGATCRPADDGNWILSIPLWRELRIQP
jgi:hypothetical protein